MENNQNIETHDDIHEENKEIPHKKANKFIQYLQFAGLMAKMMWPIIWKSLKPFILVGVVAGVIFYMVDKHNRTETQIHHNEIQNVVPK